MIYFQRTQILRIDLGNTSHVDNMPLINGENVITLEYDLKVRFSLTLIFERFIYVTVFTGQLPDLWRHSNRQDFHPMFEWQLTPDFGRKQPECRG